MCSSLFHTVRFLNLNGYPVSHRSTKQNWDTIFIYPSTYSFITLPRSPSSFFLDWWVLDYWKKNTEVTTCVDNKRLSLWILIISQSNYSSSNSACVQNSVYYSSLMKCTWHWSIVEMKANALPCPLRLVSSHWFPARHLLTPAKVRM